MDIQDFKKSLKEISDSQDIGLELYLINKDSNIQFANISKDSAKNLLSIFKDNISTLFLDEEDVKLKTIDDINPEDSKNTYYYFDSNNVYEKLEFLTSIKTEGCDNFTFKDNSFSDVDNFLIKIGNSENHILLYKKNYPINLLKQGKTIYLTKHNENINELKEDILKIDRSFQFLVIGEHILVVDLNMLENRLGYEDVIIKNAKEALTSIAAIDFLDDISMIEDMAKSKSVAKKINLVKNSPVIKVIEKNQSKVIEFINNHPDLKKSLKFSDNGKLELKSKVSVTKFLKMLDDDYLKSDLTDLLYDSLNKDKISED